MKHGLVPVHYDNLNKHSQLSSEMILCSLDLGIELCDSSGSTVVHCAIERKMPCKDFVKMLDEIKNPDLFE